MVNKRTYPMIGRLSGLLVSGAGGGGGGSHRAGFLDTATATSPRSPLEYRIQSPRGLKSYDLGGVGLGIVAALSNIESGHEILAKYAICSPNMNRSDPIPVKNGVNKIEKMENLEEYTCVTCHGPDKSFTKVYYDDDHGTELRKNGFITTAKDHVSFYPTSDFLSSCHLCKKKLHGKDIYMYRGEKAFCSVECRARQIMVDEHKEQCRSEVSRSADLSSSPYTASPIFSTGILAI